jgi:enamine deaminase RidA (YjgF/YER057c/UK114 family)
MQHGVVRYHSRWTFNTSKEETMSRSRREFFGKLGLFGSLAALGATTAAKAQGLRRRFIANERNARSGYSPAVITEGGRIVWLAGMTGAVDANGKSLAGDFDAQVHEAFRVIEQTLAQAGGKLSDLVTMTVFITDPRNHRRMTEIRREILGKDFPASASIAISHLANPNALLEIQSVAVIG